MEFEGFAEQRFVIVNGRTNQELAWVRGSLPGVRTFASAYIRSGRCPVVIWNTERWLAVRLMCDPA